MIFCTEKDCKRKIWICLECGSFFVEGELFKCDARVLDEDWCIQEMKKCPKGKWRR